MTRRKHEIHIGLTFYGGVSLAVFEAGIAYELVRAVQFSRSRDDLASLHVDVVTGTSAGGLAAFQVAAALAGKDPEGVLMEMLSLWADTADIRNLLESPPPDGILDNGPLRAGAQRLLQIAAGGSAQPLEDELDGVLTLTNLDGLGEPAIMDMGTGGTTGGRTQRFATARYVEYEQFGAGDIRDPDQHPRLTDAAVVTAGFPVAFAPTRKRSSSIAGEGADNLFTYVDGGLMDNRPLGVALDRIEKRPADERWFFFIDPSETWTDPTYGSVMTKEGERDPWSIALRLFGVARSDSVYDDLQRIRAMGDTLAVMGALRDALLRPDSTALRDLASAYPEIVARQFNASAWSIWLLIEPHADDDLRAAWMRVKGQERLRLRVRLMEYARHLAAAAPTASEREGCAQALDAIADPHAWKAYYDAYRAVSAMDRELLQTRYHAWVELASLSPSAPLSGRLRDMVLQVFDELTRRADLLAAERTRLTDALLGIVVGACPAGPALDEHRRRFDEYARGMQVLESLSRISYTPSLKVRCITPFDIYSATTDKTKQRPLAGGALAAFGGFLDKGWRLNDFAVGRLAMRGLLREGLLPESVLVPGAQTGADYPTWCNVQDTLLRERLARERGEGAREECDLLERFVRDSPMPPFEGDRGKPDWLLSPAAMGLDRLATPSLSRTLSGLARSLRRLTHDSPSAGKPPYRTLRPATRWAARVLGLTDRAIDRGGRRESLGLDAILGRIEGLLLWSWLALLAAFAALLVALVGGLDSADVWPFLLLPATAVLALAWLLWRTVRRLRTRRSD